MSKQNSCTVGGSPGEAASASLQTNLHLALKLHQCGKLTEAEAIYQSILKADPDNADALHLLGVIAHQKGKLDLAIELIQNAVDLDPGQSAFYSNLGHALQDQGQLDRAGDCFLKAVSSDSGNAGAHYGLGTVRQLQGRLDESVDAFHDVLRINPDNIDAWFKLALAEERLHRLENAADCYRRIIKLNPNFPEVYVNLGKIYKTMHQLSDAMECYQIALRLNPNIAQAHNNIGTVLQQLGDCKRASAYFQKALEINPGYAAARLNLGNAYQTLGELEDSIECYRLALQVRPEFTAAYYHLGLAYQSFKKHDQAIDAFEKALSLEPDYIKAACYLFHQLQYTCSWHKLEAISTQIDSATDAALNKGVRPEEMPFLGLSRRINPALDLKIAAAWSKTILQQVVHAPKFFETEGSLKPQLKNTRKKITLGYLSNNFRYHPTAQLISGMFRHHNRKEFSINCYSYGEDDGSEFRQKIETDSDQFIDIRMLSHAQAAGRIHEDQVDILIDLVGFTHGHRLAIAAMRPAPVQVRWLGFAGTTGADFFDYLIMDPIVAPPDHAPFYSEQLVRLPHTYQINSKNPHASIQSSPRKKLNLPQTGIVFCCFCSSYKLDPVMFEVWMRIMKKASGSVLWLLGGNHTAEKNLTDHAGAWGIDPARIIFGEPLPKDAHLARLSSADLALDSRIVNGAATTSDALWAGVPVVTIKGGSFASRMSASIISAVGLPELITTDLATYERLAIDLALNPVKLSDVRTKLAQNRLQRPLFDTPRFVGNLEKAYKKMWQIFSAGEKARPIDVAENYE